MRYQTPSNSTVQHETGRVAVRRTGATGLALLAALAVATAATTALTAAALRQWAALAPLMGSLGSEAAAAGVLEDLVALGVLAAGALAGGWYAVTALAGLALAARATAAAGPYRAAPARLERAVRRWGAPALRRVALAGLSTGMGLGLTVPAVAAEDLPADLGWGSPAVERLVEEGEGAPRPAVVPTAPTALTVHAPSVPAPARTDPVVTDDDEPTGPAEPVDAAARSTYVVEPGDSLWSIAADHLGPEADDARVSAAWPRWYAANRAAVGDDPDLIHPGLQLLVPDEENAR